MATSRPPDRTGWAAWAAVALGAIVLAAPVRLGLVATQGWPHWAGVPVMAALLEGLGPLLAAAGGWLLVRRSRGPVHLTGPAPGHALALCAVVAVAFVLAGHGALGVTRALTLGLTILAYCVMEEACWRGALYNLASRWSATRRALATGVAWYLWHLGFLAPGSTLAGEATALALLLVGSLLLDRLATQTRSVLAVALFHLVVNLLAFNRLADALSAGERLAVAALCLAGGWAVLWHQQRPPAAGGAARPLTTQALSGPGASPTAGPESSGARRRARRSGRCLR